jgi:hypothetical protein
VLSSQGQHQSLGLLPPHFLPEVCQAANITLVSLPTYWSWRKFIEKRWCWLKQAVIHRMKIAIVAQIKASHLVISLTC